MTSFEGLNSTQKHNDKVFTGNSQYLVCVVHTFVITIKHTRANRASSTDFGMGGYQYPPIGGGPKGGDKGLMGGDWRVIRDKIKGTKKISVNL